MTRVIARFTSYAISKEFPVNVHAFSPTPIYQALKNLLTNFARDKRGLANRAFLLRSFGALHSCSRNSSAAERKILLAKTGAAVF